MNKNLESLGYILSTHTSFMIEKAKQEVDSAKQEVSRICALDQIGNCIVERIDKYLGPLGSTLSIHTQNMAKNSQTGC